MRITFKFSAILYCFLFCWEARGQTRILSESAVEDLKQFKKVVLEYHPEPFRYISQEEWEGRWEKYTDSIAKLNTVRVMDLYREISILANLIRDEHFMAEPGMWEFSYYDKESLFFPFQIHQTNRGTFIIQESFKESLKPLVGKEILTINGYTSEEIKDIIKLCWTSSASSDYAGTFHTIFDEDNFSWFFRFCIEDSQVFRIKFSDGKAVGVSGVSFWDKYNLENKAYRKYKREERFVRDEDIPVFDIFSEASSAFLKMPTFTHENYGLSLNKAKKEMDKFFEKLQQEKIKFLTIDVRGNNGGSSFLSTYLASFFFPHPFQPYEIKYGKSQALKDFPKEFRSMGKATMSSMDESQVFFWEDTTSFIVHKQSFIPFDGDVAILINADVWSAAVEFTKIMQSHPKVTIYGSETGGDRYIMTGDFFKSFALKNSSIYINLPLIASKIKNTKPGLYGIKPDIEGIPNELLPPKKAQE